MYLLSELHRQLMDAIKPIGWALPTSGTQMMFYDKLWFGASLVYQGIHGEFKVV